MKLAIKVLFLLGLVLPITTYATVRHSYSTVRTRPHRTYHSSYVLRPYYGGGKHTVSHGGSYPGSVNSHHRNGHYQSPVTGTRTYGRHEYGTRRYNFNPR